MDTNGAEESVLFGKASSFQRLSNSGTWVAKKVPLVERCPQFRGVLIYRGLALCLRTCLLILQEARVCCTDGRVVKALDSKSNGLCPRRFESCSVRLFFFFSQWERWSKHYRSRRSSSSRTTMPHSLIKTRISSFIAWLVLGVLLP